MLLGARRCLSISPPQVTQQQTHLRLLQRTIDGTDRQTNRQTDGHGRPDDRYIDPAPRTIRKKVKVAHTRLPSVGFRSWSRFSTVSLHVTWVINPAVGCHYFPPGLQLPLRPLSRLLLILLLGKRGTMGVNSLPNTVTQQRHELRFEPGPFCAWVQHANHWATEPPYNIYNTMFDCSSQPVATSHNAAQYDGKHATLLNGRCTICFV